MYIIWSIIISSFFMPFVGNAEDQLPLRYKPGEVIVKYSSPQKMNRAMTLDVSSSAMSRAEDAGYKVVDYHFAINMGRMEIPEDATVEEAVDEISSMPGVEYAEPNYRVYFNAVSDNTILDELLLENLNGDLGYDPSDSSSSANKVIVAVIDTGVDYTHEALSKHMWINRGEINKNGIDDDRNGFIDDYYGWNFEKNNSDTMDDNYHGTHVAGIVVKAMQDARAEHPSVEYLQESLEIMALKFLDKDGSGYISDAIQSINYAIRMGAKIMNNSWGGSYYSRALEDAISAAYHNNRLFVVAAGNDARDIDTKATFPPSYTHPNLISVAALNSGYDYSLAYFSNYGVQSVDVGAPGVSILSSYPGDRYRRLSGTSMASPYVAGVAAAIWAINPSLNHIQVKDIILRSATTVDSLQDYILSPGNVSTFSAISLAAETGGDSRIPPLNLPPLPAGSVDPSSDYYSSNETPMGCAASPFFFLPPNHRPPRPDLMLLLLPIILLLVARLRPVKRMIRVLRRR